MSNARIGARGTLERRKPPTHTIRPAAEPAMARSLDGRGAALLARQRHRRLPRRRHRNLLADVAFRTEPPNPDLISGPSACAATEIGNHDRA